MSATDGDDFARRMSEVRHEAPNIMVLPSLAAFTHVNSITFDDPDSGEGPATPTTVGSHGSKTNNRRATLAIVKQNHLFPGMPENTALPEGKLFVIDMGAHRALESCWLAALAVYIGVALLPTVPAYFAFASLVAVIPLVVCMMKNSARLFMVIKCFQWLCVGVSLAIPLSEDTHLLAPWTTSPVPLVAFCCALWYSFPIALSPVLLATILIVNIVVWGWEASIAIGLFVLTHLTVLISITATKEKSILGIPSINSFHYGPMNSFQFSAQKSESTMFSDASHNSFHDSSGSGGSAVNFSKGQHVVVLRSMSDELRGPSSNLVNLVRMLRQELPVTGSHTNTMDHLEGTCNRLLVLLNSYLDLVKLSGDGISLENQMIDVQHLIRLALSPSLPNARLRSVPVIVRMDPQMPNYIIGDEVRISQVCSNLFDHVLSRVLSSHVEIDVGMIKIAQEFKLQVEMRCFDPGFDASELSMFQTSKSPSTSMVLRISKTLATDLFSGTVDFEDMRIPVLMGGNTHCTLRWQFPVPHSKYTTPLRSTIQETETIQKIGLQRVTGRQLVYVSDSIPAELTSIVFDYIRSVVEIVHSIREANVAIVSTPNEGVQIPQIVLSIVPIPLAEQNDMYHYICSPFYPYELYDLLINLCGSDKLKKIASTVSKSLNVLVAEDNAISADILKKIITKSGSLCTVVENGQRCVDAYMASPSSYHVILMDVCMPVLDGIQATRMIRSFEETNSLVHRVRIYAVTANALATDEEECFSAGADGYFTKPISRDTVRAILETTISMQSDGVFSRAEEKNC